MAYIKGAIGALVSGRLTKDAESKPFGNNKEYPCTEFGLFVGKDKSGEQKYLTCAAKFDLSDAAAGLKKGDYVFAVGEIETWEYKDNTYTKFIVEHMTARQKDPQKQKPQKPAAPAKEEPFFVGDEDDESLPF
jgi:hypothetical protein